VFEVNYFSVALGFALTEVKKSERTVRIIPQLPTTWWPSMKLPTVLTIQRNIPVIRLTFIPEAEIDIKS